MDGTSVKSERLLQIYSRLASGDVLPQKRISAAVSCHGTQYSAVHGVVALIFLQ